MPAPTRSEARWQGRRVVFHWCEHVNHSLAILLVSSCLLISTACVAAETSWTIESLAGSAFCFKTPLTVRQSGHDDINVIAEYRTDSFKLPVYYSIRLSRWTGAQAWELELVHAKIRLHNNPPEIQKFEISHGYNLIVLNLARKIGKVIYGLGAGIVLTHPENVVRVKRLAENRGIMNDGYYVSGPVVQLNIERRSSNWGRGGIRGSYALGFLRHTGHNSIRLWPAARGEHARGTR